MKFDSKYPWFIFDMAAFVIINSVMIAVIIVSGRQATMPSAWQFFLFGLAVFRGADIISNESITEPLRAPFVRIEEKNDKEVERPKKYGFRGAMGALVYCPSCTGTWVAMGLVYLYIFYPVIALIIASILSLSGFERLLTNLLNILKKTPEVMEKMD